MRSLVVWALIVMVPVSLLGQTGSAILHAQGGVWINGNEAPDASAVFVGDVIETKPGFSATLTLEGSSVLIQPESIGKLQQNLLELDHGSVSVGTSKGFRVKVNCILVVPMLNEWTQYEVIDLNGTVQVAARKDDVRVEHEQGIAKTTIAKPPQDGQSGGSVVHEGQQSNNDESAVCGAGPRPTAAGLAVNPKLIGAAGGGAAVLLWLLLHGGGKKTPVSNWQP